MRVVMIHFRKQHTASGQCLKSMKVIARFTTSSFLSTFTYSHA